MNKLFSNFLKYAKLLIKPSAFILLYLALYFAAQIIIALIAAIPQLIIGLSENPDIIYDYGALEALVNNIIFEWAIPGMLISIFVCLPIYFLISKLRKQNFFEYCKFYKTGTVVVGLSLILGISMNVFVTLFLNYINNLIPLQEISKGYENLAELIMSGNTFLLFITVGIMGPIIEEVIFRGLVYSELRKVLNVPAVIIIQALLFAVYHMNIIQGVNAFFIGVVLGIAVYKTGSIWPAIAIHISFNSINVLMSRAMPESFGTFLESYHLLMFAASILLTAAILMLIWFFPRRDPACIEENSR